MEVGVYGNMLLILTPHILKKILKFLIEFFRPRKLDKDGKELDHRTHWTLFFVVVFIVFVVLPIVNKFV